MYCRFLVIPGTFVVKGLIDFFRSPLRQKPYFMQVHYTSRCDVSYCLFHLCLSHRYFHISRSINPLFLPLSSTGPWHPLRRRRHGQRRICGADERFVSNSLDNDQR
jgi:hypothetical protein